MVRQQFASVPQPVVFINKSSIFIIIMNIYLLVNTSVTEVWLSAYCILSLRGPSLPIIPNIEALANTCITWLPADG
jgi:hypothetical protein